MRPDQVEAGPVFRVVGISLARPRANQDLVHLVAGGGLLILGHLGPDDRLHEAVDLHRVTARIHPGQREPRYIPDHPAEQELLAQALVERQQRADHLVAVEQGHRDRPRREERQQLEQPDRGR